MGFTGVWFHPYLELLGAHFVGQNPVGPWSVWSRAEDLVSHPPRSLHGTIPHLVLSSFIRKVLAPQLFTPFCWSPLKRDIPNKYPLIIKGFPSQGFCHHFPYESSSLHQTLLRVKEAGSREFHGWSPLGSTHETNGERTEAAATVI